jgi:cytochrome P450
MVPAADIYTPDAYLDGPPHAVFEELRRTEPVYWQELADGTGQPGYWAVLKHSDVMAAAREPSLFSASEHGVTIEALTPEAAEYNRKVLISMDPPQHGQYRRPLADSFRRNTIAKLERRVRERARAILSDAAASCEDRGQVEFVQQVCGRLPSQVFVELVGLPPSDWDYMHQLTEQMTRSQDPDTGPQAQDPAESVSSAAMEMAMYAIQFAAQRRTEPPRQDLTTVILESEFAGKRMTDIDFGIFFLQLVVAGNDTTVSLLSSGLLALLQHPGQLAELRADPSLIPGAVEEILRYANPVHYIARTAMADTELRGVPIRAGDRVAMYYTSANRDEEVFADPHRFDIRRSPNPHLAFGIGAHFCLGALLARLEGKVFFEELLAGFPAIELAGEPKRLRSNLINSLKQLPVMLGREHRRMSTDERSAALPHRCQRGPADPAAGEERPSTEIHKG